MVKDVCKIKAAVVQYPIVIQGRRVDLNYDLLHNMTVDSTFTSAGDSLDAPPRAGAGPLSSIDNFLGHEGMYLFADARLKFRENSTRPIYYGPGIVGDMFFVADTSKYSNHTVNKCNMMWRNPKEYVINSFHNFMFRSAVNAGNGTPQVFVTQRTSQELLFKSNYYYLAAALGGIFLALIATLSLSWGWWELERHVSLSPLEIAQAFGTPIVQFTGGDTMIKDRLKQVGHLRVRYSSKTGGDGGGMMIQQEDV